MAVVEPAATGPREGGAAGPARGKNDVVVSASAVFMGPLPPPSILTRYNDAFPNCAERIVEMAERQLAHRHTLERDLLQGNLASEKRGQFLGATWAALALGAGSYLLNSGKGLEGYVVLIGALVTPLLAFLRAKWEQDRELKHKAENPTQQGQREPTPAPPERGRSQPKRPRK